MENSNNRKAAPIGVFDSGYGGLTILNDIKKVLPQYDFLYLGDNARAPYGTRSFEVVYKFTLQCVKQLFKEGCQLVILACNTASAKALRTIQQNDLPHIDSERRVLGIIRPTVEVIGELTKTKNVGLFATSGTVQSGSYPIEIAKIDDQIVVHSVPCPMWVPLIENNEHLEDGANFFVAKYVNELLQKNSNIDSIILGCTHYPLIKNKIEREIDNFTHSKCVNVISQGEIVAQSLKDYLNRHPEMEQKCSKNGKTRFITTESPERFSSSASIFLEQEIVAEHIELDA